MAVTRDPVVKRAKGLLKLVKAGLAEPAIVMEAYQGTLNLMRVIYGSDSIQEKQLIKALALADTKVYGRGGVLKDFVAPAVEGSLNSLLSDLADGLTGNVAAQASGEVLGDLLGLAKKALSEGGTGQKNVAAVLVAAAFEDTLRRLAALKAGVVDRPKLEEIVGKLKAAGVLVGAAVSTANGYLKFRNDALHADWDNINEATIQSCMAFVEGLLLEHFS